MAIPEKILSIGGENLGSRSGIKNFIHILMCNEIDNP